LSEVVALFVKFLFFFVIQDFDQLLMAEKLGVAEFGQLKHYLALYFFDFPLVLTNWTSVFFFNFDFTFERSAA
jgi:hypothetical protein